MKRRSLPFPTSAPATVGIVVSVAWALVQGCEPQRGKLDPEGRAGAAASSTQTERGGQGGESGLAGGMSFTGGTVGMGEAAGTAGDSVRASGGRATCIFTVDPPLEPSSTLAEVGASSMAGSTGASPIGTAGTGNDGAPTVTVQKHGILGEYLADMHGMSLYLFGADTPGDCSHPPASTCLAADGCVMAWPVFYASPQRLAEGLDTKLFGQFLRSDGVMQTTYRGWPLYLYRSDVAAGDTKGHGRGIWYLAETEPPNVLVRRSGTERYLSDAEGRTLYAYDQDALGTLETPPLSACIDTCRSEHPPFMLRYLEPVSLLNPVDFTIFLRSDGATQIAFKGAPLYWSSLDLAPGDAHGLAPGWSVVPE